MKYVSSYFSPDRGAAAVLIGFIDRCKSKIDVAIYAITHDDIAEALCRAHRRGVKVRILVDELQARSRYSDDEKLILEGISLKEDATSGAMHNKFIIGDGSAVITGSFNWSKNADERNAENFVIIRLQYVVKEFSREFSRLWSISKARS